LVVTLCRSVVTRFAPAPTGFLHLGHIVNAIYVWGAARARGGSVLLRIEDHDSQRSRREYEQAILDDLEWLGFVADGQPVRQSERGAIYEGALNRLRSAGLVYACECSRSDIDRSAESLARRPESLPLQAESSALQADVDERPYRGTCAFKRLAEAPGRSVRVRLAPATERFVDLRLGPQTQRPFEQCGDLVVKDRAGNWTYQFAATVDDYLQAVTLVIRGVDLLASAGRQIQLARLLGRLDPPAFLHHPLVMKNPTQKLSKSDGDTGVREWRARGWTAADVIGQAACLAGLVDAPRRIDAEEASRLVAV
jgi:glutamyl-Q tRNA(Asp) synthetase